MTATIDLMNPSSFSDNSFWSVLRYLRDNDPIYWHSDPNLPEGGFWVISRYRHAVEIYADAATYSSGHGMNLGGNNDAVAAASQRMLIVSDPPRHTEMKRVLSTAFGATELKRLDGLIETVVQDLVDEAVRSSELDFIDVARRLPNHVVCAFMSIPRSDWKWIGETTEAAFEGETPGTRSAANAEIFLYFAEIVKQRRRSDGNDLIGVICRLAGEANTSRLDDLEIVMNLNGILSGANETTRYSSAGALHAFALFPEQYEKIRSAGRGAIDPAVEEILRWTVPGLHAMRTVTRDATIDDTTFRKGDRITVWNSSANRDESVFLDSDMFCSDRRPNRHLTFGHGRHMCLGSRLARMELSVLTAELSSRVQAVKILSAPVYNGSNFTWGLKQLHVELLGR